jgi:hypothetical protein
VCSQAKKGNATLGLPIFTPAVDLTLIQSPSNDNFAQKWVGAEYKLQAGLGPVREEVKSIWNRDG